LLSRRRRRRTERARRRFARLRKEEEEEEERRELGVVEDVVVVVSLSRAFFRETIVYIEREGLLYKAAGRERRSKAERERERKTRFLVRATTTKRERRGWYHRPSWVVACRSIEARKGRRSSRRRTKTTVLRTGIVVVKLEAR
tara:strand:- start:252 stop:680 length:429 start_codon:yes stop_codon:yes gene_type:complete